MVPISQPMEVNAPHEGLWRVARGDNPLTLQSFGRGLSYSGANRFDLQGIDAGVLYFGSNLEACFGETLARFRPSVEMLSLVEDEWSELGFMDIGAVAADWRLRRSAVHVHIPSDAVFLDVESVVTHQFLRRELALGLSALGLNDLDVARVRGPDRRVTHLIANWAYQANNDGEPIYAGIRYESRIRTGWECWALFDDEDLHLEVIETVPITIDMPELRQVATLFGLTVF